MRSYLFVPGNDERKIVKAFGSDADAVVLDLEDSVSSPDRREARSTVRDALVSLTSETRGAGPAAFVRINPLDDVSGDDEALHDLDAIIGGRPDGVMLPKCRDGAMVGRLSDMLAVGERKSSVTVGATRIIAIATETARSIFGLGTYGDVSPRLAGLAWGAEDLSADLGAYANRDDGGRFLPPYQLVRNLCLIAAHAVRVEAIDTVHTDYGDHAGLRRECEDALRDGFTAKMAIHPSQVSIINEVFTPPRADVEKAEELVAAFAEAGDPGVLGIDGKMFDRPHLLRAEKIVRRAATYGVKEDPAQGKSETGRAAGRTGRK